MFHLSLLFIHTCKANQVYCVSDLLLHFTKQFPNKNVYLISQLFARYLNLLHKGISFHFFPPVAGESE